MKVSDVFSNPINIAFVSEWPGSSILSVGLKEATVTATLRMGKMTGGGREIGEAKVQGGGEGEGVDLLAEEGGERRDQKWILAREQVEGLVNWAVSSTQVKNKQTNKQTNNQINKKTNIQTNKQ